MIDLHTHTTASDGRCTPAELVARAAAAGVHVLSVTDHDTAAASEAAATACSAAGIEFVPGIEITATADGADVHVLGYFLDVGAPALRAFLAEQRRRRMDRVRQMIDRLRSLGISLDADAVLQPGIDDSSKAAGRPWIARALVAGGYVKTATEAFDRWLSYGRPAFVPRAGARPEEVFAKIREAGGVTSLAHPGLLSRDECIAAFAATGLDALEAYHPYHDAESTARYLGIAARLALEVSGGSDYHADPAHGAVGPGSVALPHDRYERLKARSRG